VDIAVPIYNESGGLESSIVRLRRYLDDRFPFPAVITIVDNASTDSSWEIASRLARTLPGVRAMHLDKKGRGRALREAWTASDADVVAYMDVDLSTGLDALLPLVAPLVSGHGDVAIGSRLAHGAQVARGPKRELISRLYNLILRVALRCRFSDAQCGFKAMRADDARVVLPLVVDNEWFFDTELLVVAERAGLRVSEVPVDWSDDPNSSVHIADTAIKDLQGVWRMLRTPRIRVAGVGAVRPAQLQPTLAELLRTTRFGPAGLAVYATLLTLLGQFLPLAVANLSALVVGVWVSVALRSRRRQAPRAIVGSWPVTAGAAMLLATSAVATSTVLGVATLVGAPTAAAAVTAATVGMSVAALARFLVGRDLVFRASQDRAGSHSSDADPRSPGSAAETGGSETPSPTLDAVDLRPTGTDADVLAHR
jgi:hypothetical protein